MLSIDMNTMIIDLIHLCGYNLIDSVRIMDNSAVVSSDLININSSNVQSTDESTSNGILSSGPAVSAPLEPVELSMDAKACEASMPENEVSMKKTSTSKENFSVIVNDDDHDEHPKKSTKCCSKLSILFLGLALISFTLFSSSIVYIAMNREKFNGKYNEHKIEKIDRSKLCASDFFSEQLIDEETFNLTHPTDAHFIVTVSRLGASIRDIFIPSKGVNGVRTSRSIVLKGGEMNSFGSVRFGFDDPKNSMNMTNQLPPNYLLLNAHREQWKMYGDINKPYRVRFVYGLAQIIYEFTSKTSLGFVMRTVVSTRPDQQIVADPTNNVYFNLRGHGDLSTHVLNISSSWPFNITQGQRVEQDRLIKAQRVDKLINVNNYFYKLDRSGIGKNHIATLSENETNTTLNIFSNHAGVVIDPFGLSFSDAESHPAGSVPNMRGVRISPRQSPIYQPVPLYGPTLVVYPSEATHSTWWQFETNL